MADLPHPYGAYLRLQNLSDKNTCLDGEYFGQDAALEALLSPESISAAEAVDVERVSANAARKERYRAALRAKNLAGDELGDPDVVHRAVEAREIIRAVEQQVANEDDWDLLQAVAEGEPYFKLAVDRGVSEGSLRVRVSRIRHAVVAIAA